MNAIFIENKPHNVFGCFVSSKNASLQGFSHIKEPTMVFDTEGVLQFAVFPNVMNFLPLTSWKYTLNAIDQFRNNLTRTNPSRQIEGKMYAHGYRANRTVPGVDEYSYTSKCKATKEQRNTWKTEMDTIASTMWKWLQQTVPGITATLQEEVRKAGVPTIEETGIGNL
jgi:hypothetical protein